MIPKIIHCFWSGGPKTELAEKCLASWRRYAPDYEIREWTLEEVGGEKRWRGTKDDLPAFVAEAIAARKWAFVSDWVRFAVLKEHGGVYFDLDQELVKPISALPEGEWVASLRLPSGKVDLAPGAIALEKGSPIAQAMLDFYATAEFDPKLIVGEVMERKFESLKVRKFEGLEVRKFESLKVLEPEVMCPLEANGKLKASEKTIGIHWFAFSWGGPYKKFIRWLSWHGFRPLVDALLRVRRSLKV